MDSMNMTDTSNTTSMDTNMSTMMMKTYLHFTPGDTLIFQSIIPTSPGSIFGACLILFVISVADRYLRAVCRGVERGFSQRAKRLTTAYYFTDAAAANDEEPNSASNSKAPVSAIGAPVAPTKFILSHELSRGLMAGLQSTLHYLLMLVVMTFNASFVISVILGVVVGEVAFGRLNHGM